jgi:hypothetical protein
MRVSRPLLIWTPTLAGLVLGLCLASFGWNEGLRHWLERQPMTYQIYGVVNAPAIAVVYLWHLAGGGSGAEGIAAHAAYPFGVVLEWLLVGLLVGLGLHKWSSWHHEEPLA